MARKPTRKRTLEEADLHRILDKTSEDRSAESDAEKLRTIRQELLTDPEWEDYPCRDCDYPNNTECPNMCKKWEAWFKLRFKRYATAGKEIAKARDERKRLLSLEQANKDMNT